MKLYLLWSAAVLVVAASAVFLAALGLNAAGFSPPWWVSATVGGLVGWFAPNVAPGRTRALRHLRAWFAERP